MSENDDSKQPTSPVTTRVLMRQSESADQTKAKEAPSSAPSPSSPRAAKPGEPDYDPEACLDAVLEAEGLNRYGDPQGLMYAGGTPLFNERTGTMISRREYIGQRRPDLLERCPEVDDGE